MTPPSVDALLTRIHRHYPRDIEGDDSSYVRTEEFRRLECVLHACAANVGVRLQPMPESDQFETEQAEAEAA